MDGKLFCIVIISSASCFQGAIGNLTKIHAQIFVTGLDIAGGIGDGAREGDRAGAERAGCRGVSTAKAEAPYSIAQAAVTAKAILLRIIICPFL